MYDQSVSGRSEGSKYVFWIFSLFMCRLAELVVAFRWILPRSPLAAENPHRDFPPPDYTQATSTPDGSSNPGRPNVPPLQIPPEKS